MKRGWISIHRKIQDHWIWKEDRVFNKAEAWIDILFMANHCDDKFLIGNELINVKTGSFITSELKLMKRWKWSKSKLRAFLYLLESDGMISKKSDNKKTTISIVNYKDYQVLRTTEKPQEDQEQTSKGPQKNTDLLESDGMISKKGDNKKTTISTENYRDYQVLETTENPQEDQEQTSKGLQKDTNNNYNNYNNNKGDESEKTNIDSLKPYEKQDFISDWNKLRAEHLKLPSFLNTIPKHSLTDFAELKQSYSREQFQFALIGLFKQKKLPNDSKSMQSNPAHFLKFFETYLTAYHDKNSAMYGKPQMQE